MNITKTARMISVICQNLLEIADEITKCISTIKTKTKGAAKESSSFWYTDVTDFANQKTI